MPGEHFATRQPGEATFQAARGDNFSLRRNFYSPAARLCNRGCNKKRPPDGWPLFHRMVGTTGLNRYTLRGVATPPGLRGFGASRLVTKRSRGSHFVNLGYARPAGSLKNKTSVATVDKKKATRWVASFSSNGRTTSPE